jgi:hypothetical protein
MQREALIGLTVLLTLAVLAAPEPNVAPAQVEEMEFAADDPIDAVSRQRVVMDTVGAVETALRREFTPWQFQFVGAGDSENATLTMQLDVAL